MAMAAGNNKHYRVADILPRHFPQTAERAGIGAPLVRSILADLATNARRWMDGVTADLPLGFPLAMTESIGKGIAERARLLEEFSGTGKAANA